MRENRTYGSVRGSSRNLFYRSSLLDNYKNMAEEVILKELIYIENV